jgi:mono/diheme cytochrome c family protein
MFRGRVACCLLLLGWPCGALADSLTERGSYLVNTIMACGNCHTPRDAAGKPVAERALSGGLTITSPAFTATAPNITPDPETGLGSWSDAEIRQALLAGLRPNHGHLAGVPLAAVMPAGFYKALLPDDLDAIVGYLHTVKPIRNQVPEPVYTAPVRRDPYPDAEAGFQRSEFSDSVRRGAYLVTIGHCMECHAAWSRGVSDFKGGLGKGGRPFPAAELPGSPPNAPPTITANITAHPTAGLGAWSDAEIKRAITQGVSRDGRTLKPPMAYAFYAGLRDADLDAIVAYLRTVPPLP